MSESCLILSKIAKNLSTYILCAAEVVLLLPMLSEHSGGRILWPRNFRLRQGNRLKRVRYQVSQKAKFIRRLGVSIKICNGRFCARIPNLLAKIAILAEAVILLNANIALATPAFVQANYAVPQSPQTSVTVPYAEAQAAGDLSLVVVGWADTAAQITSVSDSAGNTYYLAAGPTLLDGVASQSIYYAQNLVSSPNGGNAVTVTFTAPATYPDVRILEYSGVDQNNPPTGGQMPRQPAERRSPAVQWGLQARAISL